jgi:transcription regulator MmyB-like protein
VAFGTNPLNRSGSGHRGVDGRLAVRCRAGTDRGLTVVAANGLARALSPTYDVRCNTLRALFLDPHVRDFYRNWHEATAWAVRSVRSFVGRDPYPELLALIDELSNESP